MTNKGVLILALSISFLIFINNFCSEYVKIPTTAIRTSLLLII